MQRKYYLNTNTGEVDYRLWEADTDLRKDKPEFEFLFSAIKHESFAFETSLIEGTWFVRAYKNNCVDIIQVTMTLPQALERQRYIAEQVTRKIKGNDFHFEISDIKIDHEKIKSYFDNIKLLEESLRNSILHDFHESLKKP